MTSRPEYQSLRSSCDRCRAKKLGCTISSAETARTGVQQCTRCIRARVECVFSRRASTIRRQIGRGQKPPESSTVDHTVTNETNETNKTNETDETNETSTSTHLELSSEALSSLFAGWPPWTYNTNTWSENIVDVEQTQKLDAHILDTGLDDGMADSIGSASADNMGDIFTMGLYGPFTGHISTSSDAPALEDYRLRCPEVPLHSVEPSPEHLNVESATGGDAPQTKLDSSSLFHSITQLSALVAEIHEVLNALSNNLRQSKLGGMGDVDSYPISQVLTLTRKFSVLLRDLWSTSCPATNPHQHDASSSVPSSSFTLAPSAPAEPCSPAREWEYTATPLEGPEPSISITPSASLGMADVPTMLLVLTCYASLTRLYMAIFSQMQCGLRHVPVKASHTHKTNPEPHLEDLFSSSNETWSKMYMTVQMFLDEFHSLDGIVSPPTGHRLHQQQQKQQTSNGHSKAAEVDPASQSDPTRYSTWFAHQLEMVRTVLDQDATKHPGNNKEGVNALLRQGNWLKALLRERMGF